MARALILILGLLATPLYAAELGESYVKLFQVQLQLAKGGSAGAQYSLGEMYEQGLGTKVDLEKAYQWYEKAAAKGDIRAKHKLARRSDSAPGSNDTRKALIEADAEKKRLEAEKLSEEEKMKKKAILAKKLARARELLKKQRRRVGAYEEEEQ